MPLKLTAEMIQTGNNDRLGLWVQAFRLHYVPTSMFPATLGSVMAWALTGAFNLWYFALVVLGVTLHHMALNVIDDVFDYLHAVDRSHGGEKNPYTGGSGVLTGELLSVGEMLGAAVTCYLMAILIAITLALSVGWPVWVFVAIGLFSSIFYSTPPIRYGYRGFGELSLLVNFGPVIVLGAFFVQTRTVAWEPFVVSLVPGFLMWSMIVINEVPDYEEDRRAGKMNLVARWGRRASRLLYGGGLACAYVTLLLAAALRIGSPWLLLGLLTLPAAYGSLRILGRHYGDKLRLAPANLAMIKVHAWTLSALITAYLIVGIAR